MCADCGAKPAVTNDKRFCGKCLKRRVARDNPGSGWGHVGAGRTPDQRESPDEDAGPWGENAIRAMEDSGE